MARKFLNKMVMNNQIIIKDIIGTENLSGLKTGAIMTCNHFNAFDSFAIQMAYEASISNWNKKKFYRIIKETNYTAFPGFYGYLMRNCYTLPLSSSPKAMVEMLRSVDKLLNDGHLILVYPEQSMWWNYRKPKPLKKGAYRFAVKSKVPVVPCFITMQDSKFTDENGFKVQEYTIHIEKPIYPKEELSDSDNMEYLLNENYNIWKNIYEDVYQEKLTYNCNKEVSSQM